MDPIVESFKNTSQKTIDSLKVQLKVIRTGRANSSLVENLVVETYGGQSKLRLLELATIMTDGPSALSVTPFDPSTIQDIEKSILKSPLGLSPAVQGNRILIKTPPLSQEQREKFVKLCSQTVEEKKSIVRMQRDDARKKIKNSFEEKTLTEDVKFRLEKEIDNISSKFMEEIDEIKSRKDDEIMEV